MRLVTGRITAACLLILTCGTGLASPGAAKPAFCAKPGGDIEKLICGDARLIALDRKIAKVYSLAMKNWPADVAAKERVEQRGWIKGRNDCWKADDKRACVEESYRTRIVELQIRSGQLMAPKAVGYQCSPGENKPFSATFYQQTDPPSAVLTFGNDQVIAFLTRTASGAKYVAQNMEFWEHHGEAAVNWYGANMTCKVILPPAKPRGEHLPLEETAWRLVQFQSMDDTILEPEDGAVYELRFEKEGHLLVRADCNRGQGNWTSSDSVSISLSPVALTRALCPSKIYDRFVRDLADVRSYVVRDGSLYLSLKVDGGSYAFRPAPPDGTK